MDEADRLLDLGFQGTLDTIFSYLPRQRRTGLFSATQTNQIQDLIRAGLRNPVLVNVTAKTRTPDSLKNYYITVKNDGKLATLLSFIKVNNVQKSILFLPTCACVDYWSKILPQIDQFTCPLLALHGKMREKRRKVLSRFQEMPSAILLCTDVLSRGIDFEGVDWVFQWDPPASASVFVHRVGRTARQGHVGSAVLFLMPNEEAYVPFIEKNQRVQLIELQDPAGSNESSRLRKLLRNIQKNDREVMEKGTRAFVSHIRAYSKHECSILLKVKELPLGAMASTYGLLSLPKMPELKNRDLSDFPQVLDFDFNSVPYKDKSREALRLSKLQIYKSTGEWPNLKKKIVKKATIPWSLTKQKKDDRKEKRLKRKRKKQCDAEESGGKKKKKGKGLSEEEMKDLAADVALLKKLKKKKISDEQFEKEFGIS